MIVSKHKCVPVYFHNFNKDYDRKIIGLDEVNSLLRDGWIIENTIDNHEFIMYYMAKPARIDIDEEDYK